MRRLALRICLCASGWPSVPPLKSGATEYDVYGLALALARLGNEVCILDTSNDYQRNKNLDLSTIDLRKVIHPYANLKLLDYPSNAALTHLIRQMTQISFSVCSVSEFVRSILRNEFDIINFHHRYPGLSSLFAKKLLFSKIPLVFSSHSTIWVDDSLSISMRFFLFPETLCIKKATKVTAVSKTLKHYIMKYVDVPSNKISVIYNGVDTDVFSPYPISKNKSVLNQRIILYFSNIEKRKNQVAVIKALPSVLKTFPDAQLVLIGKKVDPSYFDYLRKISKTLRVNKRVTFKGEIPMFELPNHIREAAVVAITPTQESTIPRVLMEALSCGKATVVSRIPTTTEILPPSICNYVDPYDVDGISEAIVQLLRDEKLRNSLEQKAREFALKKFDWASIARQYLRIYNAKLSSN